MATHSRILAWRIPWIGGAWWAAVQRVAKNQTQLSDKATNLEEKRSLLDCVGCAHLLPGPTRYRDL